MCVSQELSPKFTNVEFYIALPSSRFVITKLSPSYIKMDLNAPRVPPAGKRKARLWVCRLFPIIKTYLRARNCFGWLARTSFQHRYHTHAFLLSQVNHPTLYNVTQCKKSVEKKYCSLTNDAMLNSRNLESRGKDEKGAETR